MRDQAKNIGTLPSSFPRRENNPGILSWRRGKKADLSGKFIRVPRISGQDDRRPSWSICLEALKTDAPTDVLLEINGEVILGVDESDQNVFNLSGHFSDVLGISRCHLKIIPTDTELLVVDLNSTNGTRWNGKLMTPHRPYCIYDGDVLELGNLMISVGILKSPQLESGSLEYNPNFANALNHLSTLIASNLELDVLDRVLDVSAKLIRADGVALLLREDRSERFSLKAERGLGDKKKSWREIHAQDNDQIAEALQTGRSIRKGAANGSKVRIVDELTVGAVMYLPLLTRGESVGVLVALRYNGEDFSAEDEHVFSSIGRLASIAVQETRNDDKADHEVQKKLDEYSNYQRILQALLKHNDLVNIYGELREQIRSRWSVDNVGLWLVDNATDRLEPFPKPSFHKAYHYGEELIGAVASQAKPMLENNIRLFSASKNSSEPTLQLLARSGVCAPLVDNDRVFGVLGVFSARENEFVDDDISLVTVYAQAAAIVIQKTLLFEEIEKQWATMRATVNMLQHPIMVVDQDGRLVMSNRAADALIGGLQSALSNGKGQSGRTSPRSLAAFLNELSGSKSRTKEILVGDKAYVATVESAAMIGTIILLQDVTDPVAGVFSSHHYDALAEQAFLQAKRYKKPLAALIVGFADFDRVLEAHGYVLGGQILKGLALRLRNQLRAPDILGRHHDDSFIILLPETELKNARATADRILHDLKEYPIMVEKKIAAPGLVVGIAQLDFEHDVSIDDLTNRAERVFMSAKVNGPPA